MAPCTGHLVVHHDGTLLYCTADLTDARCADHTPERHATVVRCWSVMPHGHCGYCRSQALVPSTAATGDGPVARSA
ncbi:MAG TPA: hypothetical protein VMU09_13765 [Acidimicrobiales bacterium]|nr:hypothetical protein [Acidimicrobiales bacterium]